MFVPLFLTGGSFGAAFAQSIGQAHALDLYAAVGMAERQATRVPPDCALYEALRVLTG